MALGRVASSEWTYWYVLVTKLLTVHGMERWKTYRCVFRKIVKGKVLLILVVHVDDMAAAGPKVEIDKD